MTVPQSVLALAQEVLSHRPSGLFTDVDGTISRIVDVPEAAVVLPQARRALRRLQAKLDLVAVISGRSASQARRMVRLPGLIYVGNHGLEWRYGQTHVVVSAAREHRHALQACLAAIGERVQIPGVRAEDKGVSGAVHFRLAEDPDAAQAEVLAVLQELEACRPLWSARGRMLVNVLPPVRANKGTALRALVEEYGLHGVLHIGDDVTDLDAFRALADLREAGDATAAIAVESPESPPDLLRLADATLPGVDGVCAFLEALCRPGDAGHR